MSDGSQVREFGIASNGKPLLMTEFMADWWEGVVRELGFRPTIIQGAWMARLGGGADASAGFHDGGGCLDIRTRDLTATQKDALIRAVRWGGGATGWVRDQRPSRGGMDEHAHLLLGCDFGLSTGAAWQWLNYLHGGSGLGDGSSADYHPRPNPIALKPRDDYLRGLYDMTPAEVREIVREVIREVAPDAVWSHVVREANKETGVTKQTAEAALKKAANR